MEKKELGKTEKLKPLSGYSLAANLTSVPLVAFAVSRSGQYIFGGEMILLFTVMMYIPAWKKYFYYEKKVRWAVHVLQVFIIALGVSLYETFGSPCDNHGYCANWTWYDLLFIPPILIFAFIVFRSYEAVIDDLEERPWQILEK